MEDKFSWTDELVREFALECKVNGASDWVHTQIEQFKASKLPSKEYEILSFDDGGYVHLDTNIGNINSRKIHSVKRLSDGEVFSVGDEITACGDAGVISSIVLYQDAPYPILKYKNDQRSTSIHNATKKTKQPLFITEDGKEIFEGDTFYEVGLTHWDILAESVPHNKPYDKYYKYFSTRPKAEEYILLNKPCLSVNDVVLAMQNNIKRTREYGTHIHGTNTKMELIELVKSKINQKQPI